LFSRNKREREEEDAKGIPDGQSGKCKRATTRRQKNADLED